MTLQLDPAVWFEVEIVDHLVGLLLVEGVVSLYVLLFPLPQELVYLLLPLFLAAKERKVGDY